MSGTNDSKRVASRLRGAVPLNLALALCAALGSAGTARAQGTEIETVQGDQVSIFSGDIHVPAGQDRRGMVFSLGGDVVVEGSVGEAVVIFGNLDVRGGNVRGQAVGVFSDIDLTDAEIGDQLVNVLGSLEMKDSQIGGQTLNISLGRWFPGLTAILFWYRIFSLFFAFVLLLLLAALAPDRIRVLAEEAPVRYVAAFFTGIVVWLGALVVLSVLSLTIVGLPLAIVGYFALKWLGIAGIFYAIGRRMGRSFGGEMSLLGGILLTFTIYAVVRLMPTPFGLAGLFVSGTLAMLFFLLFEVPALGLVALTRFGTRAAPPFAAPHSGPTPPAPTPPLAPLPSVPPPASSS